MADHKSALKRIRQTKVRTIRNKDRISRIRTFIKKFVASIGSKEAETNFIAAQSELSKGVSRGVLNKNTASRKISRLNKLLKASTTK